MILLGQLSDKKHALKITRQLVDKGIPANLGFPEGEERQFSIYIEKEEDLPAALDFFQVAVGIRRPVKYSKDEIESWKRIKKVPLGHLTTFLLVISIFIFIPLNFMRETLSLQALFISNPNSLGFLPEVFKGQVWRLITPIFLHFGFLHLIFNMMWLKDLGSLIEHVFSTRFLIFFVILSGIVSNVFQYIFSGPSFGGMSGVIYGLLGFLWMVKKFCPHFEYGLPKSDVTLMVGWFFLCLSGLIGPIANMAHGVGLGLGMLLGIVMGYRAYRKVDSLGNLLLFVTLSILIPVLTMGVEIFKKTL